MTRLDSARETAGNFADNARQQASQAAHTARVQYDRHIAPQVGHAFASLPPEAQQNALKALHRAQEKALAARLSAARAADQARSTVAPKVVHAVEEARAAVVPVAQEAQMRGAAALTAMRGNVTSAEIGDLAARNARRSCRSGWATGLAVAGVVAIGSGLVAWQWWRHRSNPEWLVEPPGSTATGPVGAHASGTGGSTVNGSADTPAGAAAVEDRPGPPPAQEHPRPAAAPGDDDRPKPHDPRKPH
ncbi:hypothetical protein SAMN05216371_4031 [Streptomyces sp. TLI_053]|uniref:DUF5324 family protein n=1 Tax=Streptomyces sp. TLI_053 TaxID=1855352 RepID=UPI000879CD8B|nr:DUF5324 family protein [Streptomyces sp. TLI_053]SDT70954.1 hypothetical protein SAMN05216371_4031 [Streptomyces sp. TLI_053]